MRSRGQRRRQLYAAWRGVWLVMVCLPGLQKADLHVPGPAQLLSFWAHWTQAGGGIEGMGVFWGLLPPHAPLCSVLCLWPWHPKACPEPKN